MRTKPLDLNAISNDVVRCPKCGETDKLDSKNLQYEIQRRCLVCGNVWSGGGGVGRAPDPRERPPGVPGTPGVTMPDADDDLPDTMYTGAGFRDPDKNW